MIAVDSSVAVAALITWHGAHEDARLVAAGASIPEHALLESYSVLTRLPNPLSPRDAAELLHRRFSASDILAPSLGSSELIAECAEHDLAGGASYDAIIALTANAHTAQLATRDRRAARTYELLGTDVLWVGVER